MRDIDAWWRDNAAAGRTSLLFAYAFGKAQRILHGVDAGIGPIVVHGAVEPLSAVYRNAGVHLPETMNASDPLVTPALLRRALVLAPPSAQSSPWMKRFSNHSDGFASGWMQLRGTRRRRGVDRGFVMSDHADWPGLLQAVDATGAQRVLVTHGSVAVLVRWLTEKGLQAEPFETEYGGGNGDSDAVTPEPPSPAPADEQTIEPDPPDDGSAAPSGMGTDAGA
jgi:putative mRNA 3-end processing factor